MLDAIGATPKLLPGGEIFTSLQSGAIDATEWVGPYNDLAFGFYKVAKFYYHPGWHEPGTALECFVNKQAYDKLPKDLQKIVAVACAVACQAANNDMLAEFTARNGEALGTLINEHGVQLKKFPDEVMKKLKRQAKKSFPMSPPLTRTVVRYMTISPLSCRRVGLDGVVGNRIFAGAGFVIALSKARSMRWPARAGCAGCFMRITPTSSLLYKIKGEIT